MSRRLRRHTSITRLATSRFDVDLTFIVVSNLVKRLLYQETSRRLLASRWHTSRVKGKLETDGVQCSRRMSILHHPPSPPFTRPSLLLSPSCLYVLVSSVSARGAPSLPSQPHDTERRRVGEPSRIANFFRFLFRRRAAAAAADSASSASSESSAAAAAADLAAAAAPPSIAAANARSAGGEEGARAAALAAGAAAVQLQAAHFHATGNGAGGASPYAAERGPRLPSGEPVDGVEGMAGFAIRDFLNLLQPAFVGPDPAGSIASLEQALTWPMGSAMMPGLGGGAGMVSRRRLQNPSASEAREELQFHGLLLAPHQVRECL